MPALADLRRRALASGAVNDPITVDLSRDGRVAAVDLPIDGDGADTASRRALDTIRGELTPALRAQLPRGATVAVTGMTAGTADFNALMKSRIGWVFAFVLSLAFLLLLVTFRSVVIAAKAIVLNLLSVGAAYGLLVLVFQHGWGESLLSFRSTGAIASWLPLFLFVVLFGLSMDYHVFILSRVREAYDRGMSTNDAIRHGLKSTASTVTSAAIIMVAVFGVFATLSAIEFKQIGIGLAAAILIDATIVRAVLLPAAMTLLGDATGTCRGGSSGCRTLVRSAVSSRCRRRRRASRCPSPSPRAPDQRSAGSSAMRARRAAIASRGAPSSAARRSTAASWRTRPACRADAGSARAPLARRCGRSSLRNTARSSSTPPARAAPRAARRAGCASAAAL